MGNIYITSTTTGFIYNEAGSKIGEKSILANAIISNGFAYVPKTNKQISKISLTTFTEIDVINVDHYVDSSAVWGAKPSLRVVSGDFLYTAGSTAIYRFDLINGGSIASTYSFGYVINAIGVADYVYTSTALGLRRFSKDTLADIDSPNANTTDSFTSNETYLFFGKTKIYRRRLSDGVTTFSTASVSSIRSMFTFGEFLYLVHDNSFTVSKYHVEDINTRLLLSGSFLVNSTDATITNSGDVAVLSNNILYLYDEADLNNFATISGNTGALAVEYDSGPAPTVIINPAPPTTTTTNAGTAAISVDLTPFGVGDLLILSISTANENIIDPAGWIVMPNTPIGTGTASAVGAVALRVFYRVKIDGDTTVAISDSGQYQLATVFNVPAGTFNTTTPINTTSNKVDSVATANLACPEVTPTVGNAMIYNIIALDVDANGATISSPSNPNISNLVELFDNSTNAGRGGGLAIYYGNITALTPTPSGATTLVGTTSTTHAYLTLAIAGPFVDLNNKEAVALLSMGIRQLVGANKSTFYTFADNAGGQQVVNSYKGSSATITESLGIQQTATGLITYNEFGTAILSQGFQEVMLGIKTARGPPLTSTLGLQQSLTKTRESDSALIETLGLQQVLVDKKENSSSLIETLGLNQSLNSSRKNNSSLTETLGLNQDLNLTKESNSFVSETLGLNQSLNITKTSSSSLVETLGLNQNLNLIKQNAEGITDSLGIQQNITAVVLIVYEKASSISSTLGLQQNIESIKVINAEPIAHTLGIQNTVVGSSLVIITKTGTALLSMGTQNTVESRKNSSSTLVDLIGEQLILEGSKSKLTNITETLGFNGISVGSKETIGTSSITIGEQDSFSGEKTVSTETSQTLGTTIANTAIKNSISDLNISIGESIVETGEKATSGLVTTSLGIRMTLTQGTEIIIVKTGEFSDQIGLQQNAVGLKSNREATIIELGINQSIENEKASTVDMAASTGIDQTELGQKTAEDTIIANLGINELIESKKSSSTLLIESLGFNQVFEGKQPASANISESFGFNQTGIGIKTGTEIAAVTNGVNLEVVAQTSHDGFIEVSHGVINQLIGLKKITNTSTLSLGSDLNLQPIKSSSTLITSSSGVEQQLTKVKIGQVSVDLSIGINSNLDILAGTPYVNKQVLKFTIRLKGVQTFEDNLDAAQQKTAILSNPQSLVYSLKNATTLEATLKEPKRFTRPLSQSLKITVIYNQTS